MFIQLAKDSFWALVFHINKKQFQLNTTQRFTLSQNSPVGMNAYISNAAAAFRYLFISSNLHNVSEHTHKDSVHSLKFAFIFLVVLMCNLQCSFKNAASRNNSKTIHAGIFICYFDKQVNAVNDVYEYRLYFVEFLFFTAFKSNIFSVWYICETHEQNALEIYCYGKAGLMSEHSHTTFSILGQKQKEKEATERSGVEWSERKRIDK